MADNRSVLVVGGAGALGTAIIEAATKNGAKTISVDLRPSKAACHSIVIVSSDELEKIMDNINTYLVDRLDSVYCAAGSWQGGSITSPDLLACSQKMWAVNVEPSILAAQLAQRLDAKMLVLTSAKAILHGTPDMIGYGIAKQAVAHLAKSLGDDPDYKPKVACILPEVIDTEANRKAMPGADTSRWTKLEVLGSHLYGMVQAPPAKSGSLITVVTRNNETTFATVQ